jgi:hypothetical protein
MYHCLLHILKAEWVEQAPETPQQLRQELARHVARQVPPEEMKKGTYGGIWANNEYLPLEEALESTYGGEAALAVFVQVYDVTIHCHAPESRNTIQTFKSSSPDARGYHMLQTYSWNSWQLVEKKDPKTNAKAQTYKHFYGGDHWQLLEPKVRQRALKTLQFDSMSSAPSAAPTVPKSMRSIMNAHILPEKLFAEETTFATRTAIPSAASAASPVPRSMPSTDAHNIDATKPIAAETKFTEKIEVQLMLRAVRTHPYMCNAKLNAKNCDDKLELETIHSNNFFVYNFENNFDRGYPSHIRKILQAFEQKLLRPSYLRQPV